MKIELNTINDFDDFLDSENLKLSTAIVDTIIDNLNSESDVLIIAEILVKDEDVIIELSVEKKDFIETLETNLISFEKYEKYEKCSLIKESIDYLKKQSN
jgi:hypothetical protein